MTKNGTLLAGSGLLAIALATANTAGAQTPDAAVTPPVAQLGEVIVTAERHSVNLQKAPLTITALSGAVLQRTAINSYSDVLEGVNSVVVQGTTNTDSTTPTIAIRGLGTDGGSRTQATAVYIDGVIVNNAGLQFYDLNRVEVLEGPQATLYGGVATAGAVNVITNNPSFGGFHGDVRVGYGSYNQNNFAATLNVPLSDSWAVRAAVNEQGRSNYWGSSGDGRDEVNGRLKVLYQPKDNFSLLLGAEAYHFSGNINDGLAVENARGDLSKPIATRGSGSIDDDKVYANLTDDLGWAVLTSITAYQKSNTYVSYQGVPYVPANPFAPGTPPVFTTGRNNTPYQNQVTQELRLANEPSAPITWVTGMFFQRSWEEKTNSSDSAGLLPLPTPAPVIFFQTINVTQYHPFAQATYTVLPGLRVTGGVSYDSYEINYPQTQTTPSGPPTFSQTVNYVYDKTFKNLDGIFRVESDLTPRNLVYASFSTGFRPGGPGGGTPAAFYGKETVTAYEVGSKNRFLNNRLQINADFYYDDFPSFQNQTNTLDATTGTPVQGTVVIAAKLYGVELNIDAKPTPVDTISVKAAYEHGVYGQNLAYATSATSSIPVPTGGAQMTHAPDWNMSADYSHDFRFDNGSDLLFDVDARYESKQIVAFDTCAYSAAVCTAESNLFTGTIYQPQYAQSGYALVNASAAYAFDHNKYIITLFGRNLGDALYKTNSTFGIANIGDPRTYGVLFAAKF